MEQNSKFKTFLAIIGAIALMCVVGWAGYCAWTNSKVGKELTEEAQVRTIDQALQERADYVETKRFDSLYCELPDIILIDIYTRLGTDISNSQVAIEYECNSRYYNDVYHGAVLQKEIDDTVSNIVDTAMRRKPSVEPDTLPNHE